MATQTPRLGLSQHSTADVFRVLDYVRNWAVLEEHPGVYVCTKTSRPTWTTSHAGMLISETDTGLVWRWDGSNWRRVSPAGLLGRAIKAVDTSTSSTTAVTVLSVTVTKPAGDRALMVLVEAPSVYSTAGLTRLTVQRGGSTVLSSWLHSGTGPEPGHLAYSTVDTPPEGSTTYSLLFNAEVGVGGTSTVRGLANAPVALSVVEV